MSESAFLAIGAVFLVLGAFLTAVGLLLWPLLCLSLPLAALGLVLLIVGAVRGRRSQVVVYANPVAPLGSVGRYCENCGRPMMFNPPNGQYWCGACQRWARGI